MSNDKFEHEQLMALVKAAGRAPSGDNIQPWYFSTSNDSRCLEAYLDQKGAPIESRATRIPGLTSVGAAMENARLFASAKYGRALPWSVEDLALLETGREAPVATCTWGDSLKGPRDDALVDAIFERHVNRFKYDGQALTKSEEGALRLAADTANAELPGAQVKIFQRSEIQEKLFEVLSEATPLLSEIEFIRDRLFENIKFTKKGDPLPPDGMPANTLGMSSIQTFLLSLMRNKRIMDLTHALGMSRGISAMEKKLAASASVFILILAEKPTVSGLLNSGAAMQRLWLAATQAKLAVQPMTSGALHGWFTMMGETDFYSAPQRERALKVAERFASLYPESAGAVPVMFFRVGHAAPFPYRCGRWPAEKILKPSRAGQERGRVANVREALAANGLS